MFVEFDNELVFPIIEMLLGGAGDTGDPGRELSEIEDEIMQDIVLSDLAPGCDCVADAGSLAFTAGPRIKAAEMHQAFSSNEKATVFSFGVQLGSATGTFRLVLSTEFVNTLLKQIRLDQPQRKSRVWSFPDATPPRAHSRLRRGGYRRIAGPESSGTRSDCTAARLGAEAARADTQPRNVDSRGTWIV
jgi:hypothetical protein